MRVPPQNIPQPTFFPYNERMQSRRLDYVLLKGGLRTEDCRFTTSREIVGSDHEGVILEIRGHKPPPGGAWSTTMWATTSPTPSSA